MLLKVFKDLSKGKEISFDFNKCLDFDILALLLKLLP